MAKAKAKAKAKASLGLTKYQLAFDYYEQAANIIESRTILDKRYLSTSYQGMAICKEMLFPENPQLAEEQHKKAIGIYDNPETYNSNYINANILLVGFYRSNRIYQKAQNHLFKFKSYYDKLENPDDYSHGRIYEEFGRIAYRQNQFDSAEVNYRKALIYFGKEKSDNVTMYSVLLNRIADIYESVERYDEAQKLILEALNLLEEAHGKLSNGYLSQLEELAILNRKRGNYPNAIVFFKQALQGLEQLYGKDNSSYVTTQYSLGLAYNYNQNYHEALLMANDMKINMATYTDELHDDYLNYLEVAAGANDGLNNHEIAEDLYLEQIAISKKLYGITHEDYAQNLREIGKFYKQNNKLEKALIYYNNALDIIANTQGTQSIKYAWFLENQGKIHYSLENYKEALSAKEQIINIYKKEYGEVSSNYINAKWSMASLYDALGRYNEAEQQFAETLSITIKYSGKYSIKYSRILEDMGSMYRWWEKPEKAIEKAQLTIHILDSLDDTPSFEYLSAYNVMGLALQDLNRYNESESYLTKARSEALDKWGKTDSYFVYTNNLAFVYIEREEYATAEKLLLESGSRFKEYEVVSDLKLVNHEDNLAALYLAWKKMDLAEKYWTNVTSTLLKRINSNFTYMSESEKANFWNAYKKDFEYFNGYALKAAKSNPIALGQMYDNQLQTKSILLSSSTKERTKIINSGDSVLINKYYEYITIKEKLSKYYGYTK